MNSPLINHSLIKAVKSYASNMQNKVTLVLQKGSHDKRDDLVGFLKAVSSASVMIQFEERDLGTIARSPITFTLKSNDEFSGIYFSGIPGGHEFNSLILAILQCGGADLKLDGMLQKIIKKISDVINFQVFVSLSCQNCPDVVQTLNKFAILNKNISVETIDGGLFQDLVSERGIQGVPSVYLNDERFLTGRVDVAKIIEQLQVQYPDLGNHDIDSLPMQDVTVIGGGPAGISAAIYSARKGLKVTLVAEKMGGQVAETLGIENMISVSSTTGAELTKSMQNHLKDYHVSVKEHQKVIRINKADVKEIELFSGEIIQSRSIIIATGANWKELNIPGEKENLGNGVAYCPHCDGPFFKNKDVVVVGGGNSGVEAALDLSSIVNSTTIIEFLPDLKADQILVDQAKTRKNINILCGIECKEIHAINGKVSSISYIDRETKQGKILKTDGVFVQIGLVPNSHFLNGIVALNEYGEIIIDDRGRTSEGGIFACGDATNVPYKQISISMGEGAKAAIAAAEFLQTHSVNQ
ncbi:MAG: alkyl hydroperoxide reductase subunit F [Proteobacteria bacterium]|nr:alkyl hydroperoxide reductase subunit F [Pseudomonadota bacterium]